MDAILNYLFYFQFTAGVITLAGVAVASLLERMRNLPHWAQRFRNIVTAVF